MICLYPLSDMNPKCERSEPGARPIAASAASMAGVPDPHIGDMNGVLRFHLSASMHAAARVSCIGAEPGIFLYPRFERGAPLVSR